MIMPRGQQRLLLPAKPWFIVLSLLLALFVDMLPIGPAPAMPQVLAAVVLVFWNVHQSRRIGVGWAFLLGLLVDVSHGAVLGQHALAYTGLILPRSACTGGCCGSACSNRRCKCCPCSPWRIW
jgi:rod shape-determining protein MreD